MSFPRLVLSGDVSKRKITSIAVSYDNNTALTKPALLTRSLYDIKREYRLKNVSGATAERYPNLVYDETRLVHTWIGYIDVLTESVSITASSSTADALTVALLNSAVVLQIANGVQHTIASFAAAPGDLGPDKPSAFGQYTTANQQGQSWVYKITKNAPKDYTEGTSVYWLIKDAKVQDNQNNTSRVTFTLGINEAWNSLPDIIDNLDT